MQSAFRIFGLILILTGGIVINSLEGLAKDGDAFKIGAKTYSLDEISKEEQGRFYDLELKRFELIESVAKQKYLDSYFQKLAASKKQTVDQAREAFIKEKAKVSESEKKTAFKQFADHPSLKDLAAKEREAAIMNYLEGSKGQEAIQNLLAKAEANKEFQVLYPLPKEPKYDVLVTNKDFVRYGPDGAESPTQCKGEDCQFTIVEYSEFQCPYCERAMPAAQEILKEYKGKIRWIVRDYPIPSHDRAKPAAIAAHCAGEQGKFWDMYTALFKNQRTLADENISKISQSLGLDKKAFEACQKDPSKVLATIGGNIKTGEQLGVTGTPTFFINGKRVSGALPASAFKKLLAETEK